MRQRGAWSTLNIKRAVTLRDPRASGMVINFPLRLPSRIPLRVRALGLASLVSHTTILPYNLSPTTALTGMHLLLQAQRGFRTTQEIVAAADLQIELFSREISVVYG